VRPWISAAGLAHESERLPGADFDIDTVDGSDRLAPPRRLSMMLPVSKCFFRPSAARTGCHSPHSLAGYLGRLVSNLERLPLAPREGARLVVVGVLHLVDGLVTVAGDFAGSVVEFQLFEGWMGTATVLGGARTPVGVLYSRGSRCRSGRASTPRLLEGGLWRHARCRLRRRRVRGCSREALSCRGWRGSANIDSTRPDSTTLPAYITNTRSRTPRGQRRDRG